jgi:hypothetical protein
VTLFQSCATMAPSRRQVWKQQWPCRRRRTSGAHTGVALPSTPRDNWRSFPSIASPPSCNSFRARHTRPWSILCTTTLVGRTRQCAAHRTECDGRSFSRQPACRVHPRPATGLSLGSVNLSGAIVTGGGLAFIGATLDRQFRAFDIENGRELWSAGLPAGGKATPMTYRVHGRQDGAIAAGGDGASFGESDEIVVFALPSTTHPTDDDSIRS